jgi:hypothetical protein
MIKMGRSPKIVLHRLASNDWKRACARSTTYLVCMSLCGQSTTAVWRVRQGQRWETNQATWM